MTHCTCIQDYSNFCYLRVAYDIIFYVIFFFSRKSNVWLKPIVIVYWQHVIVIYRQLKVHLQNHSSHSEFINQYIK